MLSAPSIIELVSTICTTNCLDAPVVQSNGYLLLSRIMIKNDTILILHKSLSVCGQLLVIPLNKHLLFLCSVVILVTRLIYADVLPQLLINFPPVTISQATIVVCCPTSYLRMLNPVSFWTSLINDKLVRMINIVVRFSLILVIWFGSTIFPALPWANGVARNSIHDGMVPTVLSKMIYPLFLRESPWKHRPKYTRSVAEKIFMSLLTISFERALKVVLES